MFYGPLLQIISSLWICHCHSHFKHGAPGDTFFNLGRLRWSLFQYSEAGGGDRGDKTPHHLCSQPTSSLSAVDQCLLIIFPFTDTKYPYSSNYFFVLTSLPGKERNRINICRMSKLRIFIFAKQVMSFPQKMLNQWYAYQCTQRLFLTFTPCFSHCFPQCSPQAKRQTPELYKSNNKKLR